MDKGFWAIVWLFVKWMVGFSFACFFTLAILYGFFLAISLVVLVIRQWVKYRASKSADGKTDLDRRLEELDKQYPQVRR